MHTYLESTNLPGTYESSSKSSYGKIKNTFDGMAVVGSGGAGSWGEGFTYPPVKWGATSFAVLKYT